jgi:hypothetical protein
LKPELKVARNKPFQGEVNNMKTIFAILTLTLLTSNSFAAQTDYQADSVHGGMTSTPFKEGDAMPLPPAFANSLKSLLLQCVVQVMDNRGANPVDFGPKVLPRCSSLIQTKWDSHSFSDIARVDVRGIVIFAKTFDGRNSDGGDEFDIAVYDAQGTRRALRTAIYTETSSLIGLGALAGVTHFQLMQKQVFDSLSRD